MVRLIGLGIMAFFLFCGFNWGDVLPKKKGKAAIISNKNGHPPKEKLDLKDNKENSYLFLGEWQRIATYSDGVLMNDTPAILTLEKNAFVSLGNYGMCSGGLDVKPENTIVLNVIKSTIPYPPHPPYSIEYHYTINDETEQMTMRSGTITEVYVRHHKE